MHSRHSKVIVLAFALVFGWAGGAGASEPSYCAEELARMSWPELERIYRQAEPGSMPNGFAKGRVVYCSDDFLAGAKTTMSRLMWKGKLFCAADATLVNQWCGIRAIRAVVYQGTSWLDGKPSLILDYSGTSRVWADARDEMREVSPGIYVGAMHLVRCPEPRIKVFFVLQTCP
jgi:hypothetical protein